MINPSGFSYSFGPGVFGTPSPAISPQMDTPIEASVSDGDRFTRSDQVSPTPSQKSFSWKNALKNFGKGLISPITAPLSMMMASTKNFLIGTGVLGAGITAIILYGTVLAPYLTVVGLGIGALQTGKGLYSLFKAKNPSQREAAFTDFGAATSSFGLSSLTLGSLKKFFPSKTALQPEQLESSKLAQIGQVSMIHEPLHLAPMASMMQSKQNKNPN